MAGGASMPSHDERSVELLGRGLYGSGFAIVTRNEDNGVGIDMQADHLTVQELCSIAQALLERAGYSPVQVTLAIDSLTKEQA